MSAHPNDKAAELSSLLARVASGKLSPEDADQKAEAADLERLSYLPGPDEAWPTARIHWSLTMVLAWITWRTYAEVREWDPQYLERRRDWGRLGGSTETSAPSGYGLFRRRSPTASQFERWGNHRFGPWHGTEGTPAVLQATPCETAKQDLWRALQLGTLSAYALSSSASGRAAVPAAEWVDLESAELPSGADTLRFRHAPKAETYKDPRFDQRDVLRVWPAHVRSDLDELGDFMVSSMVDNAAVRMALYERIEAEDLTRSADKAKALAPSQRSRTPKDLKALIARNRELISERGWPFTALETFEWAAQRGLSREEARELRKELPKDLRLQRGQHPSKQTGG